MSSIKPAGGSIEDIAQTLALSPAEANSMQYFISTASVTAMTKLAVDAFKIAWPKAPSWAVIVSAFVFAQVIMFVSSLAAGDIMTQQLIAVNFLQAMLAFGASIGLTEAQRTADRKQLAARAPEASIPPPVPMTEPHGG